MNIVLRDRDKDMPRNVSNILVAATVLLLVYLIFLICEPFITPLILAAVLVFLFYPMFEWFQTKMPRILAAFLSTIILLVSIMIPAVLIGTAIIKEMITVTQTIGSVPLEEIMARLHSWAITSGIDANAVIKDGLQQIAGQLGKMATFIIGNAWKLLIGFIICVLAIFFFFRDGKKALNTFLKALPVNQHWMNKILDEIGSIIKYNIAASFAAASIQGTIAGLAFAWLQLPAPILWGAIMAFFSLFPFIGSWLVWVPVAIYLLLVDRMWDALFLFIVGIALVNPIDNILRPAIIASQVRLNGLLVFIGLLGGIQAFGLAGLLLGPVLIIVAISLVRSSAGKEEDIIKTT